MPEKYECQVRKDGGRGSSHPFLALSLQTQLALHDACFRWGLCPLLCPCGRRVWASPCFERRVSEPRQQRMYSGLHNLVQKRDKPLGGKGRLTKALIEKLTDYYGWALRNHSDNVAAMQRAVMATFYHVTSTDEEPHHDLCPEGADSWCRHKAAEARCETQPKHKYNLPGYVAATMLPVYERLSQASLLQRCLGAKTQNASESFHSVLWSLMPREQHASLIAVETALHEAMLKVQCGLLQGYSRTIRVCGTHTRPSSSPASC